MGFILALNESVQGKALDVECSQSPAIGNVIKMLNEFDEWITQIPPTEQPQRFGNKSFRIWHERLQQVKNNIFYKNLQNYLINNISEWNNKITKSIATKITQSSSRNSSIFM